VFSRFFVVCVFVAPKGFNWFFNSFQWVKKCPRESHLAKLNFRKYSCSRLRGREAPWLEVGGWVVAPVDYGNQWENIKSTGINGNHGKKTKPKRWRYHEED
jgi:hypothetical protein